MIKITRCRPIKYCQQLGTLMKTKCGTHSSQYILMILHKKISLPLEKNAKAFIMLWILFLLLQHAHRFFHLGVHVPFYLHFWGYIQIFGGAMYPLTLHLGVQRKLTAFSPRKVVHHAVFVNIMQIWRKPFLSV